MRDLLSVGAVRSRQRQTTQKTALLLYDMPALCEVLRQELHGNGGTDIAALEQNRAASSLRKMLDMPLFAAIIGLSVN